MPVERANTATGLASRWRGPAGTVLIGGAAGGVGVFAVQLARLAVRG